MSTSNTMQSIKFKIQALAESVNTRATKGVLFLVVDDANVAKGLYTYAKLKKVTENYEADNKNIISTAFSDYKVKKVVVAVSHHESGITGCLNDALKQLNKVSLNGWLSAPQVETEADMKIVADFIKSQRNDEDYPLKGVLFNYKSDCEAIVNFTGKELGEITSNKYSAQVAAQLCVLGPNESITNHTAKNVTSCDIKDDNDECVSNGELFLFNDGSNIVFSRGVNSLQTIQSDQSETLTKIRVVEVIDLVKSDMREIFKFSYFGKLGNSYKNRKTLINSLNTYLKTLSKEGYLSNDELSVAELDVDATRDYLENRGIDTENMTDEEILKSKLETYVFVKVTLKIMDCIEDIVVNLQYVA